MNDYALRPGKAYWVRAKTKYGDNFSRFTEYMNGGTGGMRDIPYSPIIADSLYATKVDVPESLLPTTNTREKYNSKKTILPRHRGKNLRKKVA